MRQNQPVKIVDNGNWIYSTWIRSFRTTGKTTKVFMRNGSVFSKSTKRQLPYAQHKRRFEPVAQ